MNLVFFPCLFFLTNWFWYYFSLCRRCSIESIHSQISLTRKIQQSLLGNWWMSLDAPQTPQVMCYRFVPPELLLSTKKKKKMWTYVFKRNTLYLIIGSLHSTNLFVISYNNCIQLISSLHDITFCAQTEYILGLDKRNGILCEEHWSKTPSGDWTRRILWPLDTSEISVQPKLICSRGWNWFYQEPPGSRCWLRFCSHISRLLVSLFIGNLYWSMFSIRKLNICKLVTFILLSYSHASEYK